MNLSHNGAYMERTLENTWTLETRIDDLILGMRAEGTRDQAIEKWNRKYPGLEVEHLISHADRPELEDYWWANTPEEHRTWTRLTPVVG